MPAIVPVVEGPGDVEALPVLLRRVLAERFQRHEILVLEPKKASGKGKLVKDLERFLQYAAITPGCSAILVLLDADDDCPKERAVELARRSRDAHVDLPIAIVCANREYEAWFLASLDTIRGKNIKGRPGLSDSASFAGPVETLRGAKEWLTQQMPPGRAYKETLDQAPLSEHIDLSLACERSRSFRRLCHAVEELVQAMAAQGATVTP